MKKLTSLTSLLALLLALILSFGGCLAPEEPKEPAYAASLADVPEFDGRPYAVVNNNKPFFTEEEIVDKSYESYSDLDSLGRCGAAVACVGRDIMPTDDREGSLSAVTPSGWINVQYDCVDGGYLYNRAHLIGWQLTAELANKENLITGTRYMNVSGMLPFENQVAAYIKETDNHVMYRVTPIFKDVDLVASGVLMEAYSVEDEGDGIEFCVYVYNNQPGVRIDYRTGESKLDDGIPFPDTPSGDIPDGEGEFDYVLNTSSKKIHKPTCGYAESMKEENKLYSNESLESLKASGYEECSSCMK